VLTALDLLYRRYDGYDAIHPSISDDQLPLPARNRRPVCALFVRSRQAWVVLDAAALAFKAYYDAAKLWPPASLRRHAEAKARRKG
jgi:hypothetical protein